ncbi:restriction endonuclease subunit S [Corynebacterium pseudodiphtheriticum]|uniref:restriction endonuclease subunit S n=1 Tax=Corynebacterium pseudodiphtheriticum TaxID=37637 RepID=UPI00234D1B4E|nr:restriction endonuclease subunit S [Corynebacterium pseudodiphtheriticum]MDC7087698.1 restriction endonuclease subunit S [Corynebacterium pseudodiphtheriticum]MDK4240792.1 restriction endonuclease subunit S [Corynebacterium pseudodiphtheriticum]MDK4321836.1 restriction endonuclease subunit S [Corynebacterium pseudodiphtheriticum]
MSRVDELIKKLCPNGVEFVPLNSVAELQRGNSITKKSINDGNVPVVAGGRSIAYFHDTANRDGETIVVAGSGAYAGFVSWWEVPIFVSDAFSIKVNQSELDAKYCFYFLKHKQETLHNLKRGSGVAHVYPKDVGILKIPVPPLEIQHEIARILDKFTQLEAELEAELEARRKQYAHYRDQLLTFPETGGQPLKLAEVCRSIRSGGTPNSKKREFYGGNVPWVRTQDVDFNVINEPSASITAEAVEASSAKWIPKNSVIVAMYGATAAKVAINAIPVTTNQACCNLEIDPEIADFKYVFYWLSSRYLELKSKGAGSQANINSKVIKNFPIVLPPLEEQRRIVAILDKFDALVNDISTGLPAEIAARRRQYEYYRDKLLSFEPV